MATLEQPYLDLLNKIMTEGHDKEDRTGTGTRSIFGAQMRFNLSEGFPILTTKRVPFGLIKSELLWFLRGDTNIRFLLEHNNHIWDEWAFKNWVESDEYHGPDMTNFGLRSQEDAKFKQVYQEEIVSAWNPEDVPNSALPPCHVLFQFYVNDGRLSVQLYQRSGDMFLGVPFNIASYSLLVNLIAQETGLKPGEFIHTLGAAHIYRNHFDQVKELLTRKPYASPKLWLNPDKKKIEDFGMSDIKLVDYKHHGTIKAPVAV